MGFYTIYISSEDKVNLDVKIALMFPICSLCYIGSSIATTLCIRNYRLHKTQSMRAARTPEQRTRDESIFGGMQSATRNHVIKISTISLVMALILFCSILAVFERQANRCRAEFTSCVWSQVWPKKYFPSGLGDGGTCETSVAAMTTLDLKECRTASFDGVPLAKFKNVHSLVLPDKGLRELPPSIGYLFHFGALQNVTVSPWNQLEIERVDWSNQNISRVSERATLFLERLPSIRYANFSRNQLVDVVETLYSVPNVKVLDLEYNKLVSIPPPIYLNLANLDTLNIRHNNLDRVPGLFSEWAFNMEANRSVFFGYNPVFEQRWSYFNGSLPSQIGLLSSLTKLYLDQNPFLVGTIPTQFGMLTNLDNLDLSIVPGLVGTIPTQLGLLTRLERLDLDSCSLHGTIPTQLGQLTRLKFSLSLQNNKLEGSIPTQLGRLTNIVALRLENQKLRGEIPTSLGKLTQIQELQVNGNYLTGGVPSELGHLTKMTSLYVTQRTDSSKFNATLPWQVEALKTEYALRRCGC